MKSNIVLSLLISIPTWAMLFPILICSVLLLAVFFERMIYYRHFSRNFSFVIKNGLVLARSGKTKEALAFFRDNGSQTARLFVSYFETKGVKDREKVLSEETHKVVRSIERFLALVSTISTICPMFGLLGTVTGMMKSFQALAGSTANQQALLATGIAEALVTTATGLLVAIPAVMLYNYMVSRSAQHLKELELAVNSVVESEKK